MSAERVTVVPTYRELPTPLEEARLRHSADFLDADLVFMAPEGLDVSRYVSIAGRGRVEFFAESWFRSQENYSNLMLTQSFYDRFRKNGVMFLYQLDAIVRKKIPDSVLENLDYIGSPWFPAFQMTWNPFRQELVSGRGVGIRRRVAVGNGGLSLRRISAFRRASRLIPPLRNRINEDLVFSFFSPFVGIRVANAEFARQLFMETEARGWTVGSPLPSVAGVHALNKHNPQLEEAILADSS